MSVSSATSSSLLDLLEHSPSEQTAIVLPEHHLSLSYGALRDQVQAVAEQLAAAGVGRGDRVGIALPNGLPMIVSFLAASVAGTAAPLNPAYMEEEFRFYLEDTSARVLILPPTAPKRRGAPPAIASRFSPSTWTPREPSPFRARPACSDGDPSCRRR